MTSRQLSEWEAYDRLDPVGSWREDFRLAYLSSLITNLAISVHGKKGMRHTTPLEFMLNWDAEGKKIEPKKQTVEEMKEILMGFANAQNKRVASMKITNSRPPKIMNPHKQYQP